MTKITEIYLNFHGDRPSMPFTSDWEAMAVAQGQTLNPPSEVAVRFVRVQPDDGATDTSRIEFVQSGLFTIGFNLRTQWTVGRKEAPISIGSTWREAVDAAIAEFNK